MRKKMFYTQEQLTAAERVLNECFTDYMVYVDSIGTLLEANGKEYDLPNHLQSKLDIIKHGMMKYEYFTVILGENFEGYSDLFKAVFSHWLDNKYLHHLSLLGYQSTAEMSNDDQREMNRKGQLLIEVTNAIAGSLNKDGSAPLIFE